MSIKTSIKKALSYIKAKEIIHVDNVVEPSDLLKGKVALVSGGTGGIGSAIVQSLYNAGASVIVGGTSECKLKEFANRFNDHERVKYLIIRLETQQNFDLVVSEAAEIFGRIDIFINSAGVHTENVDFWTVSNDEFDRVIGINLIGPFLLARAVANHMKDNRIKGHILFVNSSRGFEPAWSPYGTSKWALRGMTQGFAQVLLPYGITVNSIAPGSTATPLIGFNEGSSIASQENGMGRLATPNEIANWVTMLVSGAGDLVIGETLLVAGGRGSIDIR